MPVRFATQAAMAAKDTTDYTDFTLAETEDQHLLWILDKTSTATAGTGVIVANPAGRWFAQQGASWRSSDFVNVDPTAAFGGGVYTVGSRIRVNKACDAMGVRFAWKCAATTSVTVRLRRSSSGVVLASASVNVDVAKIYSVNFAASVDLTPYLGVALSVDAYDGVNYWRVPTSTEHPVRPMALDAAVTLVGYYYVAGNGNPTSLAGSEIYGVDLVTRGGAS